jgi:hypothetical protein
MSTSSSTPTPKKTHAIELIYAIDSAESFSSDYDPVDNLTLRSLSDDELREIHAQTELAAARAGQAGAEATKLHAQAVFTKALSQSKLARGVMRGTIIMVAGTCTISIAGAFYPGMDKEFLKVIVLTIWDKWFQLMLLVSAYYFGGINGKD